MEVAVGQGTLVELIAGLLPQLKVLRLPEPSKGRQLIFPLGRSQQHPRDGWHATDEDICSEKHFVALPICGDAFVQQRLTEEESHTSFKPDVQGSEAGI